MIDGSKIKYEYEKLPHGEERQNAIKRAIKLADEANDYRFSFEFRNDFIKENEFYGDSFQAFLIFPELMKIYDDHETELAEERETFMWKFKWILNDCQDFYQIPKNKVYELFNEFKHRCEIYGYSLRPYYQCLYHFEKCVDAKSAKKAYQMFVLSPRDFMCDCYACEMDSRVEYELENASIERAMETAHPILSGKVKCGEIPHYTYSNIMMRYLRDGDLENAEVYRKKCYRLISNNCSFLSVIADMLKLYANMDINKGAKLFEKHLQWELESKNPHDKIDFYIGTAALFKRLSQEKETIKISVPASFELYNTNNIYETETLANYYYEKAYDLCEKFDKRNESDYYKNELEWALKK